MKKNAFEKVIIKHNKGTTKKQHYLGGFKYFKYEKIRGHKIERRINGSNF